MQILSVNGIIVEDKHVCGGFDFVLLNYIMKFRPIPNV